MNMVKFVDKNNIFTREQCYLDDSSLVSINSPIPIQFRCKRKNYKQLSLLGVQKRMVK